MTTLKTPLESQLTKLKLTPEERTSLYNNLAMIAKTYTYRANPEDGTSTVKSFKLNIEVFILKFIEANAALINAHGFTRAFLMLNTVETVKEETLLILNNGLIVAGYINFDPETKEEISGVAIYRCLNEGEVIWRKTPSNKVVAINTSVGYMLDEVPLMEESHIDAVANALVVDSARMRNDARRASLLDVKTNILSGGGARVSGSRNKPQ